MNKFLRLFFGYLSLFSQDTLLSSHCRVKHFLYTALFHSTKSLFIRAKLSAPTTILTNINFMLNTNCEVTKLKRYNKLNRNFLIYGCFLLWDSMGISNLNFIIYWLSMNLFWLQSNSSLSWDLIRRCQSYHSKRFNRKWKITNY